MKKSSGLLILSCFTLPLVISCGGGSSGGGGFSDALNTDSTITATAGPNGSIDVSDRVVNGQAAIATITPDTGFTATVGGSCGGHSQWQYLHHR